MESSTTAHFCASDIVTLTVGFKSEKQVFSVHKDLICAASDYFRGYFKGGFTESRHTSIELLDPPHAVATFLDWLYKDTITLSEDDLSYLVLIPTYAFADRICSEKYSNDLMDEIRAAHKRHDRYMDTKTIVRLYDRGLQGSQPAKFGIRSVVYDMVRDPQAWRNGKEDEGMKSWSKNPEVLLDVQKEMLNALGTKPRIAPAALTGCVFHEHKGGEKCSPKKRKRGSEG